MRARELRQSSPDAELQMWAQLRDRRLADFKFRRQHPIGRYFADFACIGARLVVELDGGQHFEPDAMAADARRTAHLNAHGFHVMRFTDREALTEAPEVLQAIFDWLQAHRPHPNPLPPAGEGVKSRPLPPAGEGVKTLPLPPAGEGAIHTKETP